MSTTDVDEMMGAKDLARAKDTVKGIVRDWNWMTWNDLLADDVVLSVKLGSVALNAFGDLSAVGGNLQVVGRDEAKRVLKSIYGDLKKNVYVTAEVVSGCNFALLGNLTNDDGDVESFPIAVHMTFGPLGTIRKMTIATVDLHPLTEAVRSIVEGEKVQSAA